MTTTAATLAVTWLGRVGYLDAWERQKALHARVAAGEAPPEVLLLEHDPVYTAGKRTEPLDRPVGDPGAPVIDVDRGGRITWHGPGQLTGYPILRLPPLAQVSEAGSTARDGLVDVVAHVRRMEDAVLDVCAAVGVSAARVDGRSGVWVPADARGPTRKVAAIGVRVARGTTLHGFALNCDNDLAWFDRIVPCGIRDAAVTTLSAETGRHVGIDDVRPLVERALCEAMLPVLAATA